MTTKYLVTIAGETWELKQPCGLIAMRKMPKVLGYISKRMYVASQAGFPVSEYLSGENQTFDLTDALRAIKFVSDALGENFDEFEKEIVPYLLQRDYEWLSTNGTLIELAASLWTSIKMILDSTSGEDVADAVKKSAEEAEVKVE